MIGMEMFAKAIRSGVSHVKVIDGSKDNIGDFDFAKERFSGAVDAVIFGNHVPLISFRLR